jgi:hypothetical protein
MKTVVLPGYSLPNRDWAYEVKRNLEPEFEVVVHEWGHWTLGGNLNIKYEVGEIVKLVGDRRVNFIAKSIGTKVLMFVIPKVIKQINKAILCGIPIDPVGYAKGIKLVGAENLVIFQNTHDPFMPYKAIKVYLRLIDKKIRVIEGKRNDHHYPFYEDFKLFLK